MTGCAIAGVAAGRMLLLQKTPFWLGKATACGAGSAAAASSAAADVAKANSKWRSCVGGKEGLPNLTVDIIANPLTVSLVSLSLSRLSLFLSVYLSLCMYISMSISVYLFSLIFNSG